MTNKSSDRAYAVASFAVCGLLLWALARHSYSYYTLLRWIVTTMSLVGVARTLSTKAPVWTVTFLGIAILFNPIAPVHFDRATWRPIDIAAAVAFALAGITALYQTVGKTTPS